MKKFICLLSIAGGLLLTIFSTGCKKEYITNVTQIDSFYVKPDSMSIVQNLLIGKWPAHHAEIEVYSGNTVTGTSILVSQGTNTYLQFNTGGNYVSFDHGTQNDNGTWQLISPDYIVYNRGVAGQERYYYILAIDKEVLVTHGPFKSDGTLYNSQLYTIYYNK